MQINSHDIETGICRSRIAAYLIATRQLWPARRQGNPSTRLSAKHVRLLLDTLKNWKFFPAMKDGKPVASVQDIRVQFEVK